MKFIVSLTEKDVAYLEVYGPFSDIKFRQLAVPIVKRIEIFDLKTDREEKVLRVFCHTKHAYKYTLTRARTSTYMQGDWSKLLTHIHFFVADISDESQF